MAILLTITVGVLGGCGSAPERRAEGLIANCDFQGALALLEDQTRRDSKDLKLQSLHAQTLLVEGRTGDGLKILGADKPMTQEDSVRAGRAIYDAVKVIIRESNRSAEVAALLDSCLAYGSSLKNDAQKLAWDRAVEYLGSDGVSGYPLMQFVSRMDPLTLGRLRAAQPDLSKRYTEIGMVQSQLHELAGMIANDAPALSRVPDLSLLTTQNPATARLAFRSGWRIGFRTGGNGRPICFAESLPRNPAGLPIGVVVAIPLQPGAASSCN